MSSNTVIQIKRSGESGNVPASANINYGELAINYADGKLFYKNDLNQVKSIYTPNLYETINVGGTLLIPITPTGILSINSANGISVSACTTTDTIVIDETLSPIINISFAQANAAYDHANAAYNTANALSPSFANAAFAQANLATEIANAAFETANLAYSQANTANTTAQASFDQANTANTVAQAGFDQANTANVIAISSYNQANTANVTAQAAFDKANTGGGIVDITDYYPTANDYGYLYEPSMDRAFGAELKQISYDLSNEPVTPRGYFLTKDFGQLT